MPAQSESSQSVEPSQSLSTVSACIVAEAPDLPACFTQGENFEEVRENLIDAIELWIMAGLKNSEQVPIVNGCRLALTKSKTDIQKISEKEETPG